MSFLSHLPARLAFVAVVAATPLAFSAAPAQAIVCANGVYHAGCAGPNGAVAVKKPYAAPAHATVYAAPHATYVAPHPAYAAPAVQCRIVNGVRVCR